MPDRRCASLARAVPPSVAVAAAAFASGALGAEGDDLAASLARAEATLVEAGAAAIAGDPAGTATSIDACAAAVAEARALGGPRAVRRTLRDAARDLGRASDVADGVLADAGPCVAAMSRAAARLDAAMRSAPHARDETLRLLHVAPGGRAWAAPGRTHRFRVRGTQAAAATLTVATDGGDPVGTVVVPSGRGRFRVVWGADPGTATVTARSGDVEDARRVANEGSPGVLALAPPAAPDYGAAPLTARVGDDFSSSVPSPAGGRWSASALPAGISIDAESGVLTGSPESGGPATIVRVTVRNARTTASADVAFDADPALPADVESLPAGFAIEPVVVSASVPVKLAVAPDGRVFFNELTTGNVRVVGADGVLDPAPVATVPVLVGGECGLLGLALAPDFATSGEMFVYASTAAGDGHPARNRVLRYTLGGGGAAAGPDVVVDDLPLGPDQVENAGDVQFGPDGHLYVTVGDVGDEALAQAGGSLAGRVLRFARDGSIPATNPVRGSPEWALGFRNPFDMTFRPSDGLLFATENGPTAHDELNVVRPGHNFGWGAAPDASFGALTGFRVRDWTPVIAPTGLLFHPGDAFGPDWTGDLLVASYDLLEVRRLEIDGVDLLAESTFLRFASGGFGRQPLDLALEADGSVLVSTFTAIWRVRRD